MIASTWRQSRTSCRLSVPRNTPRECLSRPTVFHYTICSVTPFFCSCPAHVFVVAFVFRHKCILVLVGKHAERNISCCCPCVQACYPAAGWYLSDMFAADSCDDRSAVHISVINKDNVSSQTSCSHQQYLYVITYHNALLRLKY